MFKKPVTILSLGQMDSSNLNAMVGGGGGVGSPIEGSQNEVKWPKWPKWLIARK